MSRTQRQISKTAAHGRQGMVVAHNVESAEAGAAVLRDGGTAFDAAVTMGFVAAVREVAMTSIGGIGVLLAYSGRDRAVTEINFYGRTPGALDESTFVPYLLEGDDSGHSAFGWRRVRDDVNDRGFLSVGVPSYVGGIAEMHRRLGTMPWRDLLRPAARLARDGFVADEETTAHFAVYHERLRRFEEISRVFLSEGIPTPAGAYPGQGRPILQPDLAATIDRIADEGPGAFYQGAIPERIAGYVQSGGGRLAVQDFHRITPIVADGTRGSYRGYEVVVSSGMTGGSTLLEMLNIAEAHDLAAHDRYSGDLLALELEIMRQAWTDRMVYLGDPEGTSVPEDGLISKAYAATVAARMAGGLPAVTRPGDPWPHSRVASRTLPPSGDPGGINTTHLAAADRFGNVVTVTQTLGLPFGSCVIAPGTGVLLPDVAMWLNPEPGTPNSVGP